MNEPDQALAEQIRSALIAAARGAYEDAGVRGCAGKDAGKRLSVR